MDFLNSRIILIFSGLIMMIFAVSSNRWLVKKFKDKTIGGGLIKYEYCYNKPTLDYRDGSTNWKRECNKLLWSHIRKTEQLNPLFRFTGALIFIFGLITIIGYAIFSFSSLAGYQFIKLNYQETKQYGYIGINGDLIRSTILPNVLAFRFGILSIIECLIFFKTAPQSYSMSYAFYFYLIGFILISIATMRK